MKKCFFIICLLVKSVFVFAEEFSQLIVPQKIDILSSMNMNFPISQEKNPFFNFDSGLRLKGKQYSLMASVHSEKLFFNNEEDFSFDKLNFSYAGQIFLSDKLLPFNLQLFAGTLQYSSSVSRLKNPILKQSSSLSKSIFLSPGIAPSIPSLTNSAKQPSFCVSVSAGKNSHFLPTMQFSLSPDLNLNYSVYKAFYTHFIPSFTLALSGNVSSWGKNASSAWFLKRKAVPENFYTSQEALCSFNFKVFKSSTAFFVYENPFSTADFALQTKNSLTFSHFCLQTSVFASDKGFYTASGTNPDTFFQFRINPQTKWKLGKQKKGATIQAGFLCGMDFCSQNEVNGTQYNNALFQTDVFLDTSHFRFGVSCGAKQSTAASKPIYNAKGQMNYYGEKCKTFCVFSFQEDKTASSFCKETFYARFAIYPQKSILYSAQIKSTFVFKDFELDSTELSSSVTFKFVLNRVNISAKVAVCVPICPSF